MSVSKASMRISALRAVYATVVLCGVIYAFVELRGSNGIPGLLEKRQQVEVLEKENLRLQRDIEEKQARIERLEANPAEQEMEIRRRFKFAKPGEKIYILDDRKK